MQKQLIISYMWSWPRYDYVIVLWNWEKKKQHKNRVSVKGVKATETFKLFIFCWVVHKSNTPTTFIILSNEIAWIYFPFICMSMYELFEWKQSITFIKKCGAFPTLNFVSINNFPIDKWYMNPANNNSNKIAIILFIRFECENLYSYWKYCV